MRRRLTTPLVLLLLLAGCAGTPGPQPSPSHTPAPTAAATPLGTPSTVPIPTQTALGEPSPVGLPLPPSVAGIPGPGDPSVVLQPETTRGAIAPNVGRPLELGHCGLSSPIDFDGSLWNPVAGHDGRGGPLTEDQRGELINATQVTLVVLAPDVAELRTPLGAVVTIVRLPGGRAFHLCM